MKQLFVAFMLSFSISILACNGTQDINTQNSTFKEMTNSQSQATASDINQKMDTASFAAGCFWCVEVQFQQLKGVDTVISGYMGGHVPNPSYKDVCTGTTGHAEVCNIVYNPDLITYDELLAAFFVAHDPTQLNRQGNDIGTQYRSEIFYHNEMQSEKARYYIDKLNESNAYSAPIVTKINPYHDFYVAEDYHQNYYNQNSSQGYCQMVAKPKLDKFKKVFADKLKTN